MKKIKKQLFQVPQLETIPVEILNQGLDQLTEAIMNKYGKDADYECDQWKDDIDYCMAILPLVEAENHDDVVLYRHFFEKGITKHWKVKFRYTIGEEVGPKLRKKKVPQHIRVKSGILDYLVTMCAVMAGKAEIGPDWAILYPNR